MGAETAGRPQNHRAAICATSFSGVGENRYGLASGLVNTSQQIGGALGLGILTAVADERTESAGPGVGALNEGFQLGLLVAGGMAIVALALAAVLTPGRAGGTVDGTGALLASTPAARDAT